MKTLVIALLSAIALLTAGCSLDRYIDFDAGRTGMDSGPELVDAFREDSGLVCPSGTVDLNGRASDGCECTIAAEVCDNADNDCDPSTPDGMADPRVGVICDGGDLDMCTDDHRVCHLGSVICEDAPGDPVEMCGNTDDEDCDGAIDEADAADARAFYHDADHDGYGVDTDTSRGCVAPTDYAAMSGDCNDGNGSIRPGATEACNASDENCNGMIDDGACGPCVTVNREGRSYLFCNLNRSWDGARDYCSAISGYRIVAIGDATENDWVSMTARSMRAGAWWIGLRQDGSDWRWPDLSTASFIPWGDDQPDDGTITTSEDCVEVNRWSDARWNDLDCGSSQPFICELAR